jgi:hypothetical protein
MKHLTSIFLLLLVMWFGAVNLRAQTITVVTPNGGETWPSFTTQTVQWSFTGMPPTVDIYLSTDNMVTWTLMAGGVASGSMGGSHSVTVPYANSNKCFVRVQHTMTPSIRDESNAGFTIVPPVINITAPNGGEVWNIGSSYNIAWSTMGMISAVDIYETRDNGMSWSVVQMGVPNGVGGGSYTWLIGGSASTQCKVRVRDSSTPLVADTSNATFTIMMPMSITNQFLSEPLKAYPNPVSEHVVLELPSDRYTLTVTDLTGRTVIYSQVNVVGDIITVNFSNLSQGSYILRLQNDSGKAYHKKIEKF